MWTWRRTEGEERKEKEKVLLKTSHERTKSELDVCSVWYIQQGIKYDF